MRLALTLLFAFTSTCCLFAQKDVPIISISSTADITKPPEVIRLIIKVYGRGKDIDNAKEGLVAAEKKLLTKLGESGAEVIVAHAGISNSSQNLLQRYNNYSSMLMSRMNMMNGGQPAERTMPSMMERTLSIDLRSKVKTRESTALLSDLMELTRKNYAEWTGITEALKEDMKQLEEMQKGNPNMGMNMSYYRNDMSYFQNDVRFQMAAKVTREDRLKLYQEALKRARNMANDLAEAADMKLGSLNTISTNYQYSNEYGTSYYPGRVGAFNAKFPITLKEDGSESIATRDINLQQSNSIDPIVFQITLSTSFKLEPK
jgi:uncharacterized protein YggE